MAVRAYGRVPRLPVVAWLGNDTGTQDVVASSAEFPLNAAVTADTHRWHFSGDCLSRMGNVTADERHRLEHAA